MIMIGLLVKKGTEVLAVNYDKNALSTIVKKVIKKDIMYFRDDIQIDPVGEIGSNRDDLSTIGGQFARDGFYGVSLPKNKTGYKTMLVHMSDVYVA